MIESADVKKEHNVKDLYVTGYALKYSSDDGYVLSTSVVSNFKIFETPEDQDCHKIVVTADILRHLFHSRLPPGFLEEAVAEGRIRAHVFLEVDVDLFNKGHLVAIEDKGGSFAYVDPNQTTMVPDIIEGDNNG